MPDRLLKHWVLHRHVDLLGHVRNVLPPITTINHFPDFEHRNHVLGQLFRVVPNLSDPLLSRQHVRRSHASRAPVYLRQFLQFYPLTLSKAFQIHEPDRRSCLDSLVNQVHSFGDQVEGLRDFERAAAVFSCHFLLQNRFGGAGRGAATRNLLDRRLRETRFVAVIVYPSASSRHSGGARRVAASNAGDLGLLRGGGRVCEVVGVSGLDIGLV